MRSAITLIALIIYVGVFNFYIYELPRPELTIVQCKILFFADNIFLMSYLFFDRIIGITCTYHNQFNILCYLSILINFCLCFMIVTQILDNNHWQRNLYIFNGSIFATSLILLKVMARHGYFKTEYEND